MVHRLGYRFRLHKRELPGTPDLVLPRHKAVIFVNGCFWHWHPDPECPIAGLPKSNLEYWKPKLERTRARDQQHASSLQAAQWRVLVIWECQLKSPERVLAHINEFLSGERIQKARFDGIDGKDASDNAIIAVEAVGQVAAGMPQLESAAEFVVSDSAEEDHMDGCGYSRFRTSYTRPVVLPQMERR